MVIVSFQRDNSRRKIQILVRAPSYTPGLKTQLRIPFFYLNFPSKSIVSFCTKFLLNSHFNCVITRLRIFSMALKMQVLEVGYARIRMKILQYWINNMHGSNKYCKYNTVQPSTCIFFKYYSANKKTYFSHDDYPDTIQLLQKHNSYKMLITHT